MRTAGKTRWKNCAEGIGSGKHDSFSVSTYVLEIRMSYVIVKALVSSNDSLLVVCSCKSTIRRMPCCLVAPRKCPGALAS